MKKFLFSLAIIAVSALMPIVNYAQFNVPSFSQSLSEVAAVKGQLILENTANVQILPGAYEYLTHDAENPKKFYIMISLDDSLYAKIFRKDKDIFLAEGLSLDPVEIDRILRNYKDKIDSALKNIQVTKINIYKKAPEKETKEEKKSRKIKLEEANIEFNQLKNAKTRLVSEFKNILIKRQVTGCYYIFNWEKKKV